MKPSPMRGTSAGHKSKNPLKIKGSAAFALDQLRVAFYQSESGETHDEGEGITRERFCAAIVKFFPELLLLWRKTAKFPESEDAANPHFPAEKLSRNIKNEVDLDETANRLFLYIDRYQTGRVNWDTFLEAVVEYVCASLDTLEYDNRLYARTRSVSNLRCAEKFFPLQHHHELFAVSLRTQPLLLMCRSTLQVIKQFHREELGMHRSHTDTQSALMGSTSATSTTTTTTTSKRTIPHGDESNTQQPRAHSAAISTVSVDGGGGIPGGMSNRQTVKPVFVEYLPAPDLLVSYGDDRCIRAWLGASSPSIIENLAPVDCQGIVRRLRIRPDVFSHSVFTADTHGHVNRWDVSVQRPHGAFALGASYKLHDELEGGAVDFCLGHAHIYSAGYDGNLLATAFNTGRTTVVGNRSPSIRLLEYSDLCACVVSVGFDNKMVYWDPYTQSSIPGINFTSRDFPDDSFIEELHCATDLPHVITRDVQGTIKVWDLHTLSCIQAIAPSDLEVRHTIATTTPSHKPSPLPGVTGSSSQARNPQVSPQFPLSKSRQLTCSHTIGYFPATREIVECTGNGITCYGFDHTPDPTAADTQVINWALYCSKDDTFILQGTTRTSVWCAEGGWWKRCVDRMNNLDLPGSQYEIQAICVDQEEGILFLSPFNSKGRIELYSTRTLTLMDTRTPHTADVTKLAFCPARRILVAGHADGVVVLMRTAEFGVMFVSSVHASSFAVREMAIAESLGIAVIIDERNYLNVLDIISATVTPRCCKALQPIGNMRFCGELPLLVARHTVGTVSLLLVRQPTHTNPTASIAPLMTLDLVSGLVAFSLRSAPAFEDSLNLAAKASALKRKSGASSRSLGSRTPSPRRHPSRAARPIPDLENCATEVQSRGTSASNGILKQRQRLADTIGTDAAESTTPSFLGPIGSTTLTVPRGRPSFVGKSPLRSQCRQAEGVPGETSRSAAGESAKPTSLIGTVLTGEEDILQVARRSKDSDACPMDFDPISNTLFLGDSKGFVHTWDLSMLIDELDFWNAPSTKSSFSTKPQNTDSLNASRTSASPGDDHQSSEDAAKVDATGTVSPASVRTRIIKRWREEAAAVLTIKYGSLSRTAEEDESTRVIFRVVDSTRRASGEVDVVKRVCAPCDVHNGYEVRSLSWCSAANMLLSSGEDRRVVLLDVRGKYLAELAAGRLPLSLSSQLSSSVNGKGSSNHPYPTVFTQRNALSTQEYVILPSYSLEQHRSVSTSPPVRPTRPERDESTNRAPSGHGIDGLGSQNASRSGNPVDSRLNINTSFGNSYSSIVSSSGGVASTGPSSPSSYSPDRTSLYESLRRPTVPVVKRSPVRGRELTSAVMRTPRSPPRTSPIRCDEGEKLLHGDPQLGQSRRCLPEVQLNGKKLDVGSTLDTLDAPHMDGMSFYSSSFLAGSTNNNESNRSVLLLPLTPDKPWLRHQQIPQRTMQPVRTATGKKSHHQQHQQQQQQVSCRPYSAVAQGAALTFHSTAALSYPSRSKSVQKLLDASGTNSSSSRGPFRGNHVGMQMTTTVTATVTPNDTTGNTAILRPKAQTPHHPRQAPIPAATSTAAAIPPLLRNMTTQNQNPTLKTFGNVRDHEEQKRISAFERRLQTCLRGGDLSLSLSSRESRGAALKAAKEAREGSEVLHRADAFRTDDF